MLRPVTLWMAIRYLRAQGSNAFASLVAAVSVAGVALGVAALIVVLSVMNGFENELRSRLVALSGHAAVLTGPERGDWREVLEDLRATGGVTAATPYVELQGMLGAGNELAGVVIEGVDSEAVRELGGEQLEAGAWRALLGRSLALNLGVDDGDRVRLLVPTREGRGPVVSRLREVTVADVFEVGVKDHDAVRVLIHREDAAVLAARPDRVTGIRLRVDDPFAAPALVSRWEADWEARGKAPLTTTDWTRENATYFRAVRIEKVMMTLLLSLIVAVAAFNIVATLIMVVTDKRAGIAILRTLGFSRTAVVSMFALQGVLIGWVGVLAGLVGGVLLAENIDTVAPALERLFGFQFMPADVYYLTALPADLETADLVWVGGIALLLTALATLYPASRAAAVAPADVLRYE
jgi:lipoprotein-releasing system permease protein